MVCDLTSNQRSLPGNLSSVVMLVFSIQSDCIMENIKYYRQNNSCFRKLVVKKEERREFVQTEKIF